MMVIILSYTVFGQLYLLILLIENITLNYFSDCLISILYINVCCLLVVYFFNKMIPLA